MVSQMQPQNQQMANGAESARADSAMSLQHRGDGKDMVQMVLGRREISFCEPVGGRSRRVEVGMGHRAPREKSPYPQMKRERMDIKTFCSVKDVKGMFGKKERR